MQVGANSDSDLLGCDNESYLQDDNEASVLTALRGRSVRYTAASPDEKALVEASHRLGVTYAGEPGEDILEGNIFQGRTN